MSEEILAGYVACGVYARSRRAELLIHHDAVSYKRDPGVLQPETRDCGGATGGDQDLLSAGLYAFSAPAAGYDRLLSSPSTRASSARKPPR